ncbi:hypothetical protein FH972_024261 [Carpinus fangiana]|uniref:Bifunctional lycopene cyclase/phytoene synthase n=1 Tax=Carpinus fangiana TaxID=176857 RepID=A0A5N6KXX2_9ROSI|nr:hypothetical protein FH972_024261 [Carpinus fangiana]
MAAERARHVKYTIPPAIILTLLYQPLFTKLDVYKICFLVTIAVTSTIPWDSYLIRTGIWTYPPDAILGPLLFRIPLEELFFFFIQTYVVSLFYICMTKPLLHPIYLPHNHEEDSRTLNWAQRNSRLVGLLGQLFLIWTIYRGYDMVRAGNETTYFGLIISWACPFMLLLWFDSLLFSSGGNKALTGIEGVCRASSCCDCHLYLRGTWVIVPGTKIDVTIWEGLEVEEAFFFFATNTMIVLGMVTFDNAMAIIDAFPDILPTASTLPGPWTAIKVLCTPVSMYNHRRIIGLAQALNRLQKKSRSFYLASSTFEGRPRIDLILLYSFCRVADDLIDSSSSAEEANMWVSRLRTFLDLGYMVQRVPAKTYAVEEFVAEKFPAEARLALLQLPLGLLSKDPLYGLLEGFQLDLHFVQSEGEEKWPIKTEKELDQYGEYVAGTVGELCIDILLHHYPLPGAARRQRLKTAGRRMGIALQTVNIARDITVDADLGRVYIPTTWLREAGLSPDEVQQLPSQTLAETTRGLRSRLLSKAFSIYNEARPAIEQLPKEARGPMRVAIESYMEIGRVLQKDTYRVTPGAGVGGCATAARLAKAGFKVTVVEKNDFTGGRSYQTNKRVQRFDQGPSLLLLPEMFEEAFRDLGTSMTGEGIKLFKCDPNYNVWFGDGEQFELSSNMATMKREVERWEGKDGFERYLSFLQEAHRHYEASVTHVLHKNFGRLIDLARPSFLPHLLDLHPFESIYSRASKYFWTERLRRVFTFGSMYMGMSPFDAPGTYSLLQYTELAEGIWYPEGGFHRIVEAIVGIAERSGVEFRFKAPIASIKLSPDNKTATGVVLESGEELIADVIVNNSDLVYAYNNLLPPSSHAKSLSKREGSCSSISFYWALDTIVPELKTHNIFLADEYRSSFDSIFKDQDLPEEPSFYVNVPSRVDPTAAPAGKDSVVVLVPCGHLLDEGTGGKGLNPKTRGDWDALISKARNSVLDTIEARLGVRLSQHISHEIINNPYSWQERFNLDKGAILGLSHSFFNVLSFRPRTKHASISNLYFVGASTHPGTGVPIVLGGSKITSEQILDDYRMEVPWTRGISLATRKGEQKDIDKTHAQPALNWLQMTLLILVGLVLGLYVLDVQARLAGTAHGFPHGLQHRMVGKHLSYLCDSDPKRAEKRESLELPCNGEHTTLYNLRDRLTSNIDPGMNPGTAFVDYSGGESEINITTHGSDWYWAVTAVMAVSTFIFMGLSYTKPREKRIFHYITASITLVASIAYFSMASNIGWAPITVEFQRSASTVSGNVREIFYVRYIDWFITTPLLLLDLLLTAGLPLPTVLYTILIDEVMIVTGLTGALVKSSYKWGYFAFGCAALLWIGWVLLFEARIHSKTLGNDVGRAFVICGSWTFALWLLYPIAWGVCEGGNVIAPDSEAVFYGVLDILAKPVFGGLLLWGHRGIDPARLGLSFAAYGADQTAGATTKGQHESSVHATGGVSNGVTNGATNGTTPPHVEGTHAGETTATNV